MGSPLGPMLANAFLVYHEKNQLEHCPVEYRPLYYRRYVDDIIVLCNSPEHLKFFHSYLNSFHLNISFTIENEKDNKVSFLDVNIIREKDKFTTSVHCKPKCTRICTHFESFLPSSNKISLLRTLLYRCFWICSDWTKFHLELVKILVNRCFQEQRKHLNMIKNMNMIKFYINKDMIRDRLHKLIYQFNKRNINQKDFYFALLDSINPFYDENGRICEILFYLHSFV